MLAKQIPRPSTRRHDVDVRMCRHSPITLSSTLHVISPPSSPPSLLATLRKIDFLAIFFSRSSAISPHFLPCVSCANFTKKTVVPSRVARLDVAWICRIGTKERAQVSVRIILKGKMRNALADRVSNFEPLGRIHGNCRFPRVLKIARIEKRKFEKITRGSII